MTPEAQRIAIAKARGWTRAEDHWVSPSGFGKCSNSPPDYLNDLNAMHEAEKVLDSDKATAYWHHLFDVLRRYLRGIDCPTVIHMVKATAAQRAEAFLRTIGKWVES